MLIKNTSATVKFCFELSKFHNELSRRLDSRLGGIGFNELIILNHLSQSDNQKMRRIDLAEKLGYTASGITRLLLPMEKIGLITKEASEHDARVSLVKLAPSGKIKLDEGLERAEQFCAEMTPLDKNKQIKECTQLLIDLSKNI